MIKINSKSDERISEDFPNDPYSNLTILTETQQLNLQLAFLSMDSGYFAKIDPDAQEINLRHLKQEPLIRVLHSLYGEQLITNSIAELVDLYPIINFLQIDDYKQEIVKEICDSKDILLSIQFISLSCRQKICWQEVIKLHLQNKLKALQDSKNFLKLNLIEETPFLCLILQFLQRYGQAEDKVVNVVMENYFNRKNIKALDYLKSPKLQILQKIWVKYHHVPLLQITPKSNPIITTYDPLTAPHTMNQHRISERLIDKPSERYGVEEKKKKVQQMEREIGQKDQIIKDLNQKIEQIKRQLGQKEYSQKPTIVKSMLVQGEKEKTKGSVVMEGQSDKGRGRRTTKRLQDLLREQGKQENESLSDHRQEVVVAKVMNRLGSKNSKK